MSGGGKGKGKGSGAAAKGDASSSSSSDNTIKAGKLASSIYSDKVKETIKNIKEIAGDHTDEEIHAMLKECGMDPNETAQKLLLLDTFHEVKRKRDKRKENLNNRESSDSRWKAGTQGRGGRGGKGNFLPRHTNDAGDGRNATVKKENGVKQGPERGVTSSLPASQETENKALTSVSCSLSGMGNGPTNVAHGSSSHGRSPGVPAGSGVNSPKKTAPVDSDELAVFPLPSSAVAKPPPSEVNIRHEQPTPCSDPLASPVSVLGVYSSASDPVLEPSLDSRLPGTVGTIKREVGSQRSGIDSNSTFLGESKSAATQDIGNRLRVNKVVSREISKPEISSSMNEKSSPESGNSFMHGKVSGKSQTSERNQSSESSHPSSSATHVGTSNSRPSSNYGNRSQQLIGAQKAVGPSKEWKPKPTNPNAASASGIVGTCVVEPIAAEAGSHSLPTTLSASVSEESTSKLQQKLEELHLTHNQHVIIPDHLQVPEAERTGLSFGSFDANFGVKRGYTNDPDTDKSSTPVSEFSQEVEENAEEPCSSNQIESSTTAEGDFSDHPQSPKNVLDDLSPVEADVSSTTVREYEQPKPDMVAPLGGPQYSVVPTAPNYNFGLMPPIMGTQFAPFDSSEPQARDASRLPNFVVPQPFDPSASYYAQVYRPNADGDGRFSPFLPAGASNKYNGNIAVLSPQSGQPQESGNSVVLSTAGPTPLATQAAGVMQSSLAVTQQPVPVFRQPSGVHLPHYPPNYIPYSQYFPQFYLPPQPIHHYLTNTAYPQQPSTGSVYPSPTAAAATGVKYSLSQYKPVANTGNSTHVGIPSGYAPYSTSTGYSPSPAASTTNSAGNEDLSASQYKDNNVYITGQQSEGSAVWIPGIPAPGRDIPGLQASSFYSLSPQGQHVTFAPTQAGHGAYAGIYHPTQTMGAATAHPLLQQSQSMAGAVEMVGPSAGVYQQPQRAQVNWANNY